MGTKIKHILDRIEKQIGDPDKAVELRRNLDTLRLMSEPTSFRVKGVGSSSRYALYYGAKNNEHRFLTSAINNILEDLIEKHLPPHLKMKGTPAANKAWALLFFHQILKHNDLGDPQIWANRKYIRADDNNEIEDNIIFLASGDPLVFEQRAGNSINNEQFNFNVRIRDWDNFEVELKKEVKNEQKLLEDVRIQIGNTQSLPYQENKLINDWIKAKDKFLYSVLNYIEDYEKRKKKKEEEE